MNETERWAADITERARAWWTSARLQNLLGGKHLLLAPVESAPLLRAIGLLNGDGAMAPKDVRKFMQVNHMIALLEPLMQDLMQQHERVEVQDLGCGASHLTTVLAWCFKHRWKHAAHVLGVDRNAELVEACRVRAHDAGLDDVVELQAAWISELESGDVQDSGANDAGAMGKRSLPVHAVIALHACDTATCDAIAYAVGRSAQVIAVAPCCQAELSRKWAELQTNDPALAAVFSSPHLRRELAATVTDTLRMLLLRAWGYRTTAMEFVPSPHTPKNTLIRAVKTGIRDEAAMAQARALVTRFGGADIRLARALAIV